MRRLVLATALTLLAGVACVEAAWAYDVHVRGYTRSDGTYVEPHVRSSPDGTRLNNYGCINHGRC